MRLILSRLPYMTNGPTKGINPASHVWVATAAENASSQTRCEMDAGSVSLPALGQLRVKTDFIVRTQRIIQKQHVRPCMGLQSRPTSVLPTLKLLEGYTCHRAYDYVPTGSWRRGSKKPSGSKRLICSQSLHGPATTMWPNLITMHRQSKLQPGGLAHPRGC